MVYTVYGRVIQQNGKTYVQYHFFYLINEWNKNGGFVIDFHEGDWEGMMIELNEKQKPLRVTASAHKPKWTYKGGETRKWVDVEKIATHPVVYIGKGGYPTFLFNGISIAAGSDDHSGTGILLINDHNINTSSVDSAAHTIYKLIDVGTNYTIRKWLESPVYWGQDYVDVEKAVQAPKFFDPDRWDNPEKWMNDRE